MRRASCLTLCALLGALILAAPAARADTLELTDGRLVEGLVIPGDGGYYVVSRYGPTFVKAADVKARTQAKPVDQQIKEHLAKLDPKDAAGRARLAEWMKKIGREEEARALAEQVLEWDPENALAHGVLGHIRHRGAWRTFDEAQRLEGYEKHGERWYTPEEWKIVSSAEKDKAEALEKAAAEQRLNRAVNEAVRLSLSPDPAVRARGKARLQALARELDSERVKKLVAGIDDYIQQVDELRRQAAAAATNVRTAGGMMMGEIRATLSKLKRPIPIFETPLASGPIGANAPVRIMLPELEVIRVRTTMMMPATVDDRDR